MKVLNKLTLIVIGTVFSGMALACDKPATPEIPDAATAVTAQMMKAKNDVKAFMDSANAFLECAGSTKEHNDMVDEMNQVADGFNSAVREFKQRIAGN
jgi:hypothetical protein